MCGLLSQVPSVCFSLAGRIGSTEALQGVLRDKGAAWTLGSCWCSDAAEVVRCRGLGGRVEVGLVAEVGRVSPAVFVLLQ